MDIRNFISAKYNIINLFISNILVLSNITYENLLSSIVNIISSKNILYFKDSNIESIDLIS